MMRIFCLFLCLLIPLVFVNIAKFSSAFFILVKDVIFTA